MASLCRDYAVTLEADGAFRVDRTTQPFPGEIAYIRRALDRRGKPIGWRLKPLLTMRGSATKIWPSAAEAIASTKLMSLKHAKAAVEEAEPPPSFAMVGGAS